MQKKLWAGRFRSATNPAVEQFNASIGFDCALIYEDILGSLAHAAMLASCRIITQEDHSELQKGLIQIATQCSQNQVTFHVSDEDIHMNVERLLSNLIGEAAGKLHTARSRNDQVALDLHLYLRKKTLLIVGLLTQFQKTLMMLALKHKDAVLPGYTHLQRAQPISLAEHFFAYIAMFQRDIERLQEGFKRLNRSPLGACALAGTTLPTDKEQVAESLGFDGIYQNTLDAVSNRDFIIEFLSSASLIMMHISRLSEELILWSSQEFNFITFDDAYATGSSIMPQKKNPDIAELGRGKTGRVYGALFSMLTILKGLPLAYNKDLQEDKEPLFDTINTLEKTLTIYIPLFETLTIHEENMHAAVLDGFLNATVLAEYLVKQGLAFRSAHEVVGKVVGHCLNKKCRIESLSLDELQTFSPLINADVYQVLPPDKIVMQYQKSVHPSSYEEQLASNEAWLDAKLEYLKEIYSNFNVPFVL